MLELVAPSRFRAAVVVPVFNHALTIGAMVSAARQAGLRCIVVDDGSDERCAGVIDALAAEHGPSLLLVRLPTNRGKGAAVMAGLRAAGAQGFSHAVQIDADGQHDPLDIGHFVALARRFPDTLICGRPVYDSSVPLVRLIGRSITRVWVWVNTLSFAIADSMCGFRVYPLASIVPLLDESSMGSRMDFDTEVLVRAHWRGIPIVSQRTRVVYPRGGVSHFRMGLDNWLIARMHARLFVGMLRRAPSILWNRTRGRRHAL